MFGEGSDLMSPFKAEAGRGSRVLRAGGGLLEQLDSEAAATAATAALATGKSPARLKVLMSTVLVSRAFRLNWIEGKLLPPENVTGVLF